MLRIEGEWPAHPRIYQINTWVWLNSLGEGVTLLNVPKSIFNLDIAQFDAIWLMGIWERSQKSREIAQMHPDLQEEFHSALKDFRPEDVIGSPYAVHYYAVDYHLGGSDGLQQIREQLAELEIKLILDYVPNHVAIDHPWTLEDKNIFIEGTEEDIKAHPNDYFRADDRIIAHGKDPYFYPWTDTAQINAFSEDAREVTIKTLLNIANMCDGVRCDMSMLLVNDVFKKTWGKRASIPLEKEFWEEIIPPIKAEHPNFKFFAEVYWNMEWTLMQQGFDYCYDKTLYDRLKNETPKTVRAHLQAEWYYQCRLLRFIENHDEKRAITVFGKERSKAAAILIYTLPGARLIHEGQMSGYTIKLPVQLGRRQKEQDDQELIDFYLKLINSAPGPKYSSAKWSLCRINSVGDFSNTNLIAHVWKQKESYLLTVVNLSPYPAKGHVIIDDINYGNKEWSLTDLLAQEIYIYEGENLSTHGLYIDLKAWGGHIFEMKKSS
ncbi:MAG: alpha-amylase family glycosyl hydrolase [Promethearchaeota archaeon]